MQLRLFKVCFLSYLLSLEETQVKCTNMENEIAKVHSKYEEKVKRRYYSKYIPLVKYFHGFLYEVLQSVFYFFHSLEDVDTHRIRRNESVRRREEQIKSLEKSRSKYVSCRKATVCGAISG